MRKRDNHPQHTRPNRTTSQGSGRESDDSLLARIGAGERDAWTIIVDRHLPPVTRYATYVLGDAAQAEDVAQETFLRLIRKARDWRNGGATLRTWLFRVALNLCIDRKRARRTEPLEFADETPDPVDDVAIDHKVDLERYVRAAVRELPERQQAAIVLIHYEGFSGTEAANVLEVSVEALESLLARGRRSLRQQLSAVAPDLLGGL
jgi:RNA polymerase sigma-70 factor (ECF subfamily)